MTSLPSQLATALAISAFAFVTAIAVGVLP